ncbi:hypothetical protein BpHYR1_024355 [Brachionus plicatilis]|uniref:C2H2-type domain-containing protein n=1 Tax=Brachionus plicatilis TaxID=10195 RepID=A0A3M7QB52_BRAPC|nr:hypothetical protein BpHYR1_024355 [Brachionus plicatilis]
MCFQDSDKTLTFRPAMIKKMENENDFSKIASEAPIASKATQSAVKKVLSKHKNPIACSECEKLMKNERGVKQHIAKMHN